MNAFVPKPAQPAQIEQALRQVLGLAGDGPAAGPQAEAAGVPNATAAPPAPVAGPAEAAAAAAAATPSTTHSVATPAARSATPTAATASTTPAATPTAASTPTPAQPPVVASAHAGPALDDAQWHKLTGLVAPEVHKAMLNAFQHDSLDALQAMRAALQREDAATLSMRSHRMRGSALAIGLRAVADTAGQLEHQADRQELLDAAASLTVLAEQVQRALQELGRRVNGPSPHTEPARA